MQNIIMTAPTAFRVCYDINPWMRDQAPVSRTRAIAEWQMLKAAYEQLGVEVTVLPADPALPDLVFATDGSLTIGRKTALARFRFAERAPEVAHHKTWATQQGHQLFTPKARFEGGDALLWRGTLLLGHGFRTQPAAAGQLAEFFGINVMPLELIDPCFYHLDTALSVLGNNLLAYYPPAFSAQSVTALKALPVTLIEATKKDALAFGLNSLALGGEVFVSPGATRLHIQYRGHGLRVEPIGTSEFLKSGGGIKCLTKVLYQLA